MAVFGRIGLWMSRTWMGTKTQGVLMSVFEACRRHAGSVLDHVSLTLRAFGNPSSIEPLPHTR